jgi:hypothetical protein
MRGGFVDQGRLFSDISPEARVPANHPLWAIRALVPTENPEPWFWKTVTYDPTYGRSRTSEWPNNPNLTPIARPRDHCLRITLPRITRLSVTR